MKDIRAKKQEAEAIRRSKLTVEAQEEKLTAIDKDLAFCRQNPNLKCRITQLTQSYLSKSKIDFKA
jgi:hypothetical protein